MIKALCMRPTLALVIAFALAGSNPSAHAGGVGSTVGGGVGNTANGDYSTTSGGLINSADGVSSTVSGGKGNNASAQESVVGGGRYNAADDIWATVAGGAYNIAGSTGTVGGGEQNTSQGIGSTIAGGHENSALGFSATVPGGYVNVAGGDFSFASGDHATVRSEAQTGTPGGDYGTFMWASHNSDPSIPNWASTGPNQFLVSASGGFGLNATPVNNNVAMTIAAPPNNPKYASILLRDHNCCDGILVSSGDATPGWNNASFYVDQYNGSLHTRRLSVDAVGNFSITNQAYKPGGGSWAASSDGRLKANVQPITRALDQMLALKGVTFEYAHPDKGMHPSGRFSGFIAQEVEKVFPNWIGHDNDGYLTVGPQGFEALTVEALRELKTSENDKVAAVERDNAELRKLVADQAKAVADLRREVASMGNASDTKRRQIAAVTP